MQDMHWHSCTRRPGLLSLLSGLVSKMQRHEGACLAQLGRTFMGDSIGVGSNPNLPGSRTIIGGGGCWTNQRGLGHLSCAPRHPCTTRISMV